MRDESRKMEENLQKLADILTADIVNFKRMSHAHAREHHGTTIIHKAASMGVDMTPADLDHLLELCLGVEVQIEPFDRKVYDYHL